MDLATYLAHCDARYSPDQHMVGVAWSGPGYHSTIPNGTWVHPTRESLDYALALLRRGEEADVQRAAAIIDKVLSLQDTNPTSPTYGIWPWLLEEPLARMKPPDWNWADFCGIRLAQMLAHHAGRLPEALVGAMRASLAHAAWSIFRRNVQPSYTNIAIMGAGVALAAGEILPSPRLLDYGRRRLHNVVTHTAHHGGFNEYNSPTYTLVALVECERLLHMIQDQDARADLESLRRTAWQTIAEHFHPATGQWAGPHSRAYHDRLTAAQAAYLSSQTGVEIQPHPTMAGVEAEAAWLVTVDHLPCPPEWVPRFRALPQDPLVVRQRFIRREDEERSTWGTTWFTRDACLGTVNHDNLWVQRRPLIGYWRTPDDPAVVLRLRFLRDGQDFASAYLQNAQQANTVLSVISLLNDKGDFHDHLDRPGDGIFEAEEFRVRYELSGVGAMVQPLDIDRFELHAGGFRAVIHTVPSNFGPYTLTWEIDQAEGRACVDGICYRGRRRRFNFAEFKNITIVAGLELLPVGKAPVKGAPKVSTIQPNWAQATWSVGRGLALAFPLQVHRYLPARPAPSNDDDE
ncbi:MAG: hypothetical protein KatS3mg050_2030 [Litorilinea sp.]|nr:MAG: hypothetical protein KatS3mg050_2030 [Litorilinea sp.]